MLLQAQGRLEWVSEMAWWGGKDPRVPKGGAGGKTFQKLLKRLGGSVEGSGNPSAVVRRSIFLTEVNLNSSELCITRHGIAAFLLL